MFCRADKGNSVVALNTSDYINKTLSFLDNVIHASLNKDPTFIFQRELKPYLSIQNLLLVLQNNLGCF